MDRHRYRKRIELLNFAATKITKLSAIPERTTTDDLRDAADLIRQAAEDLTQLIQGELPGCTCRRTGDIDYDESCQHHGGLYKYRERLKADYAKMERALKDEVRMQIVSAALTGSALLVNAGPRDAERAIEIADETIRQLMAIKEHRDA